MKHLRKNSTTSEVILVKLVDTTSATGAGKTGLTSASAGLRIASKADVESAPVACTGSNIEAPTTSIGTYQAPTAGTKCRFREIDATNHPGIYEIFLPDARFAVSGARALLVSVSATGTTQADLEYQLTLGLDPNDSAHGGLTTLALCRDLLEADRVIDTTVAPWDLVLIKKGSGTLGQPGAVELLRQNLRDVNGGPITNTNTILGQSVT